MFKPHARRTDRPRNHYAILKQEAAVLAEHDIMRGRYSQTPRIERAVQVPKPLLREATLARREVAAHQKRPISPSPALRPARTIPSYLRSRRYILAFQPGFNL